jgi:hypothetical protein
LYLTNAWIREDIIMSSNSNLGYVGARHSIPTFKMDEFASELYDNAVANNLTGVSFETEQISPEMSTFARRKMQELVSGYGWSFEENKGETVV